MVVSPPFVVVVGVGADEAAPMKVGKGVVVNGIVVFALDNAANIPLEFVSMSLSSNSLSIVR